VHRTARLLFAGILLLLVPRPGLATTPIVLANPGFESGVSPWHICGGATHVDAQVAGANAVHSGRYAIQLQNPSTTVGCPSPPPGYEYMGLTPQALWQEVTIPADTPAVTVSFWYWVDGCRARTWMSIWRATCTSLAPGSVARISAAYRPTCCRAGSYSDTCSRRMSWRRCAARRSGLHSGCTTRWVRMIR
jgi:hypothetical protein